MRERTRGYYQGEKFDRNASAGLFIGVRHFYDTEDNPSTEIQDVPYAVDDAVDLAYLFAFELGLIAPGHITLALSGSPQKPESEGRLDELVQAGADRTNARAFNLLRLVKEVPARAEPGGLLVVSAATHGFQEDGLSWLLAQNSLRGHLARTSVSNADLLESVSRSPAPRRIVLLDACREVLGGESRGLSAQPVSTRLSEEISRSVGLAVLMGATSGGYSYDDPIRKNGVFTAAILEALRGAALSDDRGFITLDHVKDFANERVRRWVRENRPEHIATSQGVTSEFQGEAGRIPLREDEEARRAVERRLARYAELLAFLEEQEPVRDEITLEMVQVVEEDLYGPPSRLPPRLLNRLVDALEAFAAYGAEGVEQRAPVFQSFFDEWLEVRPQVARAQPVDPPREADPAEGAPGGAALGPSPVSGVAAEQAIRQTLDDYARALESLDLGTIHRIHPAWNERSAYERLEQREVEIEVDTVDIEGDRARVRAWRTLKHANRREGTRLECEYTMELAEDGWRITGRACRAD